MIVLTYRNWYVFLYINSTSKIRLCQLKSINYLNGSSVQEIGVFLQLFYINGNCLRLIFVFVKTSRVKLIIGRITIKKRAWTVGMMMLELFFRQVIVLGQVIQALFRSRYIFLKLSIPIKHLTLTYLYSCMSVLSFPVHR